MILESYEIVSDLAFVKVVERFLDSRVESIAIPDHAYNSKQSYL